MKRSIIALNLDRGENSAEVVVRLKRGDYKSIVRILVQGGSLLVENGFFADQIVKAIKVNCDVGYTHIEQNDEFVKIIPKKYPILCG